MHHEAKATLLARLGFAARGLVYLLVAWFAMSAALGDGEAADNQGAMAWLAHASWGPPLLLVVAAGLVGYALWRLTEALANPEGIAGDAKGILKRAGYALSGGVHLFLAWTAVRLALRPESGSTNLSPTDETARDWTAWLLDQPFGQVLVGIVALCFLFGAFKQAREAWRGDFVEDLRGDAPTPGFVCTMGRIGYGARALVFAILAGFFALAAWRSNAGEAGGFADALGTLRAQPGGSWLLVVTGIGLALFGLYGFVEARYRRLRVRI
jgi:hypothetical protein